MKKPDCYYYGGGYCDKAAPFTPCESEGCVAYIDHKPKAELGNGPWDKGYQPSGIDRAEECQHRGTMTLLPTETQGWEILDWCFFLRKRIKEECPSDCPYKDKEVDYE